METPMKEMLDQQLKNWQMMGHEAVFERGTVRLRQYRKQFGPDVPVMIRDAETGQKVPYLLRSGRPLMAHEVLPERADLALNEDGTLLPQHEFAVRYEHYVDSFVLAEGSDPRLEPVPDVTKYINAKTDTHGESGGLVEIDYDPQFDKPFKPTKFYGPDGETEEEYLQNRAERDELKGALDKIANTQELLAQLVANQQGAGQIVPVTTEAVEAVAEEAEPADVTEGVGPDKASAANAAPEMAEMPCGKWKKSAYRRQHMRKCKSPICQAEFEAGDGGDEGEAA